MDLSLSERLITTERLQLYVLRSRPRAPEGKVLLLGGSNFDLRLKRQFLQSALADRFEIVTYEPRGIGRTEQPDGGWSMQDYALDALSLLDHLDWSVADVVGESFGGMTALHLALLAPNRVARLALSSTTAGGAGGSSYDIGRFLGLSAQQAAFQALSIQDTDFDVLQQRDPALFQKRLSNRIAFERAFAEPSVVSGGYAKLLATRATHNVWKDLPNIGHDTLVLVGLRDRQATPDAQRAMAERLPAARTITYNDGHGVAFGTPKAMADVCNHWLGVSNHQTREESKSYG